MAYTVTARRAGGSQSYRARTEEDALDHLDRLTAENGVSMTVVDDWTGEHLDRVDLEERIEMRDAQG